MNILPNDTKLNESHKIAIAISEFNIPITEKLLEGACRQFEECGCSKKNITIYKVPGAFELPWLVNQILKKDKSVSGIMTIGAVIKGDTAHFDYICSSTTNGIAKLAQENDTPIVFGVLTTNTAQQAWDRVEEKNHKGKEVALALCQVINLKQEIDNRNK
jgi:6,7-dimethyl-8-ribityllumazine synthase